MPDPSPEALYLHAPFCRSRCRYCAFLSAPWDGALASRYLDALGREASTLPDGPADPSRIATAYVGGGTPTVLPPDLLDRLLGIIRTLTAGAAPAELTVEANPESLDGDRLAVIASAGATRISLGVQSDDDRLLRFLGRPHDRGDAERAARAVLRSGLALSVDLIYGLPGQATTAWERTLRWAVGLGAGHVSAYALTVEEGTPLAAAVAAGAVRPADEARLTSLHRAARETLGAAGFSHYEVSNFALPGGECRHNLAYWRYRPYLGLGAGAHSRLRQGGRAIARENPATGAYLAALEAEPPRDPGSRTSLTWQEEAEEILLMGLRTAEGIDPDDHPGHDDALRALRSSPLWGDLIGRSLASGTSPRLALTPAGTWLADGIAAEAAAVLAGGA